MRKGLIWGLSVALTVTSICGPVDMINAADISIESEYATEENIDFASEETADDELPVTEEAPGFSDEGNETEISEEQEEETEADLGDSSETEIQEENEFSDGLDLSDGAVEEELPSAGSVESDLQSLMNQYVGTYWTKNGQPSSNYKDSNYYYGWQCKGFGNMIFNKLFGVYIGPYVDGVYYYIQSPNGAKEVGKTGNLGASDTGTAASILRKGKPGDMIQVRRRGGKGHTMILVNAYDTGIKVFDCNSNDDCGVRSYDISWSAFASRNDAFSLYHANNYPNTVYEKGRYKVSTSSGLPLILRGGAGTGYENKGSIPNGTELDVTQVSDSWGNVCYNGVYGWVHLGYCTYLGAGEHTHSYTNFAFIEKEHPHYKCYQCTQCDSVWRNTSEPTLYDGCENNGACKYTAFGDVFYANIVYSGLDAFLINESENAQLSKTETGRKAIWKFVKQADNSYVIYSCADGKALDMENGVNNPVSEKNLQLYGYNGGTNQKWYVSCAGEPWWSSGEYNLEPLCNTGLCMDVKYGGYADGTGNVWVYLRNNSLPQKFRINVLSQGISLQAPTVYSYGLGSKSETVFRWSKRSNATGYDLKVTSSDGTVVIDEKDLTDVTYRKQLPAGTYRVKVTVKNTTYEDLTAESEETTIQVVEESDQKVRSIRCGDKEYILYDYGLSWKNAKTFCEEQNGRLAEILSEKEQNAVKALISNGSSKAYWIGLTDDETRGTFKWTSEKDTSYTNWHEGEPNNVDDMEHWGMILTADGTWNDAWEAGWPDDRVGFILEKAIPKTYTVTYHMNGGTNNSENPDSFEGEQAHLQLKDPTKKYYKFMGWYTSADFQERFTSETECNGDLDLYAKWTPIIYSLTFDVNGGEELKQSVYEISYETSGFEMPKAVREGHRFLGWYDHAEGGNKVENVDHAIENVKLYAHWQKEAVHTHDYVRIVVKEASCTEEGLCRYTCTAGDDSYEERIPAKGHTKVERKEIPATCTEGGRTAGSDCTTCGITLSGEQPIPALGHDYGEWKIVKDPTYTETGLEERVCSRNASHKESREIEKLQENKILLPDCEVQLSAKKLIYDGKSQKPDVKVIYKDKTLTEGQDYLVYYADNVKPGTASVYLEAKTESEYTGTAVVTFEILKPLEEDAKEIEADAFSNCDNLTHITIYDTVVRIGERAFADCKKLDTVRFAGNFPEIERDVFKGVKTTAYYPYNDRSWTLDRLQDYGGNITWIPWNPVTGNTEKRDLSLCNITADSDAYEYDGKAKTPKVTVKDGDLLLEAGQDYTVTYMDNINAGTAKIKVQGIGEYGGNYESEFVISKIKNNIIASNITKKTSTKTQSAVVGAKVKGNAKLTYSSDNKSVKVSSGGRITIAAKFTGTARITIKSAATINYLAASKVITVKVNPAGTSISKVTKPSATKATLTWKKNPYVSGYEIQYSTDRKFRSGVKIKKIAKATSTKVTISGLKKKKAYYFRIRTYKNIGKVKYVSSWSSSKKK